MKNNLRFILFFSTFYFIANANAEGYVRPPSGVEVNEKRQIKQLTSPQKNCVSAAYQSAYVLISKEKLEAIAAASPDTPNFNNANTNRAVKVLSLLSNNKDQWGCAVLTAPDYQFDYLALSLIEEGETAMFDKQTKAFVDYAEINYFGMVCGDLCGQGEIRVSLPSNALLFLTEWWIS
jgi:hypothetical protein